MILAENDASSWVIPNLVSKWFNVSIHHTVVTQAGKYKIRDIDLYWNAPNWGFFWGRNLFRLNWKDFQEKNVKNSPDNKQQAQTLVPRLLAAGWVFCVLKTSIKLISSIDPNLIFRRKIVFEDSLGTCRNLRKG